MKNIYFFVATCFVFLLLANMSGYSQTAGTFTFNITTTSTGGYTPKHLVAIWVENNSGTFIKTKAKYSTDANLDHLAIWTGKSGSNVVDATTGATLSTHGTLTVIWNGTDVNGNLVVDGTYKVWIEMAWASSLTTGKTSTSFTFTKGPNTFHSTPASTTNFSGITLDWVPGIASAQPINNNLPVSVSPNPTTGIVNISFFNPVTDCIIGVTDIQGKELYYEFIKTVQQTKTLDLSKLANGVYIISVSFDNKNLNFRIVKK